MSNADHFKNATKRDIVRKLTTENGWMFKTGQEIAELCTEATGRTITKATVYDSIGSLKSRFHADGGEVFKALEALFTVCRNDVGFAHWALNQYDSELRMAKKTAKPFFVETESMP